MFKYLLKEKCRLAIVIYLLQLVACLIGMSYFLILKPTRYTGSLLFEFSPNYRVAATYLFFQTSIFVDLIYTGLSSWQLVRSLSSQTIRLVPISETRLLNLNLLTGVVSCAVIFILQFLTWGLVFLSAKVLGWSQAANNYAGTFHLILADWQSWLIDLTWLVVAIYLIVGLAAELQHLLYNYLPIKENLWTSLILIILIAGLIIFSLIEIVFRLNDSMLLAGWVWFVFLGLFWLANWYLLTHVFEPQIDS